LKIFKLTYYLFIICYLQSFSQGFINNGSSTVISTGTTFYIDGGTNGGYTNLTNTADGTLDLDGEMVLEGDWTNNATGGGTVFTNIEATPNGTVTFKGASLQTIGGTEKTTFENFTLNNSTSGSALSLSTNTTISGILTFNDGILATGGNSVIVSNTGNGCITGHSNTEFIYGNLRQYIGTNAFTYVFPVGNGTATTNYFLSELVNNNLSGGGFSYLDISVGPITESGNNVDAQVSTSQSGTNIDEVLGEFCIWNINADNDPTAGDYGIKLYVENIFTDDAFDNMFCVVKRDETSTTYADWDTENATTTIPSADAAGRIYNSGSGYAQRSGLSSFSQFAIGIGGTPLPVDLLDFSAKYNNDRVYLEWITASEIDNDYFIIERSDDGILFNEIIKVDGSGNSNSIKKYTDVDKDPLGGISYYRLKQVDFNGEYSYSEIQQIFILNTQLSDVLVYPVPARSKLYFKLLNIKGVYVYQLYNSSGMLISEGKTNSDINSIDVSAMSKGLYYLKINTSRNAIIKKVVID
jgi:hypothetical protein